MDQKGVLWEAAFSSYAIFLWAASHWTVRLEGQTENIEVSYVLSPSDAEKLSESDYKYRAGQESNRFMTYEDAKGAAIAAFRFLAGPRDALTTRYGEGVILAGPQDLVTSESRLREEDWWQWTEENFIPHEFDSIFGPGAPPSRRRRGEVVVERGEDGEWHPVAATLNGEEIPLDLDKTDGLAETDRLAE